MWTIIEDGENETFSGGQHKVLVAIQERSEGPGTHVSRRLTYVSDVLAKGPICTYRHSKISDMILSSAGNASAWDGVAGCHFHRGIGAESQVVVTLEGFHNPNSNYLTI